RISENGCVHSFRFSGRISNFLMSSALVSRYALLLIPTTAMGLTLPILLADPLFQDRDFGQNVGILYGFNTLGAVAGALAGEFFLIQACGLLGTGLAAGSLSCIAASLAWFIGRKDVAASQRAPGNKSQISLGGRPPWNLLLVCEGNGAILLVLEVIWVRFLRLYVASSSIAFCVMLAVVLFAIGLGAIGSSVIALRLISPQKVVASLLFLAGIGTLLSYVLFPLPQPGMQPFDIESSLQVAWLSLALMFPVAFLSGVSLPM